MDNFIEYTTNSVVSKVYNIVSDGTKATHVVNSPYAKDSVRGDVVSVGTRENEGDDGEEGGDEGGDENTTENVIVIKNTAYLKNKAYKWDDVSYEDTSVNVTIPPNSIIVKNNKVVGLSDIEKGDKLRVLTDNLPDSLKSGMDVTGYIILVEG